MSRLLTTVVSIVLSAIPALAQAPIDTTSAGTAATKDPLVEFELMTWPEVKEALAAGKTTALIYTGGTEQRGPQNVNGGHNLMGKATVKAIALTTSWAIRLWPPLTFCGPRCSVPPV